MHLYELEGSSERIAQVLRHFSLRVHAEISNTVVQVEVRRDEQNDFEEFCDSLGVQWEEV